MSDPITRDDFLRVWKAAKAGGDELRAELEALVSRKVNEDAGRDRLPRRVKDGGRFALAGLSAYLGVRFGWTGVMCVVTGIAAAWWEQQ